VENDHVRRRHAELSPKHRYDDPPRSRGCVGNNPPKPKMARSAVTTNKIEKQRNAA
jgi:hypothetical protein